MNHHDLRAQLLAVTSATLRADGHDGASAWTRSGRGSVVARHTGAEVVEWEESGEWTEAGRSFGYRTALRWTFDGAGVHLAHLRRGPAHPVHLATLTRDPAGALIPKAPHLCGDDRYLAELDCVPGALTLHWRATGPAKDYRLSVTYR
ncbi:MAG TPA: DUF6314 family protein [Gemmatimonadales bacterium]|nr:DUF6314 family protein [Gemmatimonadales bacterium]